MEFDFLREDDPRKVGDEFVRSGRADQALEEYERGRGLDPTDPELLLRIASALEVAGRVAEAFETLDDASALHPLNAHFKRFGALLLWPSRSALCRAGEGSAQLGQQSVDRVLGLAQIAAAEEVQVVEDVIEVVEQLAGAIARCQGPGLPVGGVEIAAKAAEQFGHGEVRLAVARARSVLGPDRDRMSVV